MNTEVYQHLKEVVDGTALFWYGTAGREVYVDGPGKEVVMSQEFAKELISFVDKLVQS